MTYAVSAAKRLAIEAYDEDIDDWYVSASPRNSNSHAEGQVHGRWRGDHWSCLACQRAGHHRRSGRDS